MEPAVTTLCSSTAGTELARVDGVKRTSLIIDPPDGQVAADHGGGTRSATPAIMRSFHRFDSVKDRPLSERCLMAFGSTSGPPMLPVLYNNNYQIVQTPDTVMILVEMVHDVRIIRMNGTHAPPASGSGWATRSAIGKATRWWWTPPTSTDQTRFRGSSENLHVIERFTARRCQNTILYRATIDDPTTFTKPWTMEYPFVATPGPIYEYACHEGNYAMTDILGGARKADRGEGKEVVRVCPHACAWGAREKIGGVMRFWSRTIVCVGLAAGVVFTARQAGSQEKAQTVG